MAVLSLTDGHSTNDFVFLIMIVLIVAIAFIPRKRVGIDKVIEKWASVTLNIYLIHELFRTYIMELIFRSPEYGVLHIKETLVYFLLVTAAAVLMELIWQCLKMALKGRDGSKER